MLGWLWFVCSIDTLNFKKLHSKNLKKSEKTRKARKYLEYDNSHSGQSLFLSTASLL